MSGHGKGSFRDNIQGIMKPWIRRLARRGGVKRISGLIYEETREVSYWFWKESMINGSDDYCFKAMVEVIGQFGPGFKAPSQWQLREPLLKKMVDKTKYALKKQEELKVYGCSIVTEVWTNRKNRSMMNLCVNCKEGTTFLSSKESSDNYKAHNGEHIFKYVFKAIEQVGFENVVQIVTGNASNNMVAAKLLKEKIPHVF
ncbi:hypothetical protein EZV62_015601 [Acer yangbiense]|uniref:DUF659 domain-containing protein n=1 Tax=Acer yangbiense TaxID=1000413 RepID=A0A5C7HN84_9ROSI|nr:hypothetical protein EZV62_015601 [Acer yangbiense]